MTSVIHPPHDRFHTTLKNRTTVTLKMSLQINETRKNILQKLQSKGDNIARKI